MSINIYRANQLYSLGFTYRHYQEHFNQGMVFYYKNAEHVIGGNNNESLTEKDMKIINDGIWLPDAMHLMEWLQENSFIFSISSQSANMLVEIRCEDIITGTKYTPTFSPIEDALACLIRKILKRNERHFDIYDKEFEVIEE